MENETLDNLVRDLTTVTRMAKSEVRRRINQLILSAITEERDKIIEKLEGMKHNSDPNDEGLSWEYGYDEALDQAIEIIKQR